MSWHCIWLYIWIGLCCIRRRKFSEGLGRTGRGPNACCNFQSPQNSHIFMFCFWPSSARICVIGQVRHHLPWRRLYLTQTSRGLSAESPPVLDKNCLLCGHQRCTGIYGIFLAKSENVEQIFSKCVVYLHPGTPPEHVDMKFCTHVITSKVICSETLKIFNGDFPGLSRIVVYKSSHWLANCQMSCK